MFIELTDHLRCPADHAESYLVLIPDAMAGRRVLHGMLGCPVCHAEYPILDGVVDLAHGIDVSGGSRPIESAEPGGSRTSVDAGAILTFLGLEGPGGYLGLVGDAARFANGLAAGLPGAHLVAVNPPVGVLSSADLSVMRSPRIPFKERALRGAVVGLPFAWDPDWQLGALRAVLPGLRTAGQGPVPAVDGFELLGAAEDWWVGRLTHTSWPPPRGSE